MTTDHNDSKNARPFAVFDIDGTLIRWQLYHAVADALFKLGYFNPVDFEKVRQARRLWKQRSHSESFKDYESHLVLTYESMLANLTVSQFNEAAEEVFEEYKDQVYTYTRDLISELKTKNYLLFAISGSQAEIVNKVATYYRFDDCVGSQYEQKNGRFTGKLHVTKDAKHLLLKDLVIKHRASYQGSLAVGDSEGDISMLEIVEHPIVFNPSKLLFKQAKAQGWPIVLERKNMIYRLEHKNGSYFLAKTDD